MTPIPDSRLADLIASLEVDELGIRKDSDTAVALRELRDRRQQRGWMPIETAPKDGSGFIATNGRYAYLTKASRHYVKWPHEEGGPTYQQLWSAEDGSSTWPWRPTLWHLLPPTP